MSDRTWTAEQQQCIYSHGGTLLVSAAAGSGKTSVLVQRIIERITDAENPIDVNRLLVVTFTRAAAAEMKNRLAEKLTELIHEHPEDLRLQRQQLLLPRAVIGTIDSFCTDLIRENFHLLDISPQFRIVEEQQLALLQKEALTEALNECYASGDEAFEELASMLSNGKNDTVLMSTIERIYKFIQPHPDPHRWLSNMAAAYEETASVKDTVWGAYVITHISDALEKALRLCKAAIDLAYNDPELTSKYRPALLADQEQIATMNAVCQNGDWNSLLEALQQYTPAALKTVRKCDDIVAKERIKVLRDEIKSLLKKLPDLMCGTEEECRDDLSDTRRSIWALYVAVRRFSEIFAKKKAADRLLDFSDIEHYALQLLTETAEDGTRTPSALAQELAMRYDEILVDEYQDTNAVQDALFSAISRNETNLFMVGDVKQSIYGFRQAMPELFLGRRAAYPAFDGKQYPATITLGNNFRSRREVTEAVNFTFRQLMSEEVGGLCYDEREMLVQSLPYPDPDGHEPEFLLVDTTPIHGAKLDADVAEAEAIATRITELVGTLPVGNGEQRPLRYGDCCILLRSRRPAFREVLERRGIPVASDTSSGFFDTAEIRLALSVLRCIDNPLQDVPLTAWLLSPLCGFSPDDMALIRRCRPRTALYTALTAARTAVEDKSLAQRCRRAVDFLDHYRTLSCQLTVDRLVTRLYEETALPELMSARPDGERRRNNLQLLQETCTRFEQSGFRGLSAFVRYIDRLQANGMDLPGAVAPSTDDAVHILTIHGSKGLEFPVVFLAGLGHEFNRQALTADLLLHPRLGGGMKRRDKLTCNRYATLPHQALALRISNDERAEELRVLYVAMTRAREKLCFSMALSKPCAKLASLAALLDDQPALSVFTVRSAASMGEWLASVALRHPSAAAWREWIGRSDLPTLPDDTPWHFSVIHPTLAVEAVAPPPEEAAMPDPVLTEQLRERMAYRYPHTALARIPAKLAASDTAHGDLQRTFVATSRPAFLNEAGLSPTERGTALHTFMQFARYENAAEDLESEIARLAESGFLSTAQARSLDRGKLSRFFGSAVYERMRRSPRLLREFPFTALQSAAALNPTVDSSEHLVIQGIADCVFEENGELVIVDYKTDRVKTAEELIDRYRGQLEIYRRALSEALALPVRECILYSFVLGRAVSLDD